MRPWRGSEWSYWEKYNHNIVSAKMAKTFSYRRQDVVQALPVKDFKE
jgi:hypothetical protein